MRSWFRFTGAPGAETSRSRTPVTPGAQPLSRRFFGMVGPTFKAGAHAYSLLTVRRSSFESFASPISTIASASRSSALYVCSVATASSTRVASRRSMTPCRTGLIPMSPA
jgi:hypothetical protein